MYVWTQVPGEPAGEPRPAAANVWYGQVAFQVSGEPGALLRWHPSTHNVTASCVHAVNILVEDCQLAVSLQHIHADKQHAGTQPDMPLSPGVSVMKLLIIRVVCLGATHVSCVSQDCCMCG